MSISIFTNNNKLNELNNDQSSELNNNSLGSHVHESNNIYIARIYMDYHGNVYLVYNDITYLISLNTDKSSSPIELLPIKNINIFKKHYLNNIQHESNKKCGKIILSNNTLKGKASENIDKMTDEEREDYIMKNEYFTFDISMYEKNYYRIKNDDDNSDDDNDILIEDNVNDEYTFNQHSYSQNCINFAELLCPSYSTYNTIYIDGNLSSKNVITTIEKKNNYCPFIITIYSTGYIRANFIERSIMTKLMYNETINLLEAISVN